MLLGVPVLALGVFFLYPLAVVLARSLTDPVLGWQNYAALFTDSVTLKVLTRTVMVAVLVSVATLLLGYPYAYCLTIVGPASRRMLLALVLLPFWVSLLARTFAWYILEERGGLIDMTAKLLGFDGLVLLHTWPGVAIAMVQLMLPYMVLPLYSSLSMIDRQMLTAASSLGAGRFRAFFSVYFPLSVPGVVAGCSLVLVVTLGFYITPALLGSPAQALMSQVIERRLNKVLDFGGASAMGIFLLVVTLVLLWVASKAAKNTVSRTVLSVAINE